MKYQAMIVMSVLDPLGIQPKSVAWHQSALEDLDRAALIIPSELLHVAVSALLEVKSVPPSGVLTQTREHMRNIANYLVIQTEVDIDEEAFVSSFRRADTPSDMPTESILENLVSEMLAFDLEKLAGQVILALTIAQPGGIRFDGVSILVNGKQIEEVSLHTTDITEARIEAEEMHWPPLSDMSFARTFRWLIAAKGMKEGLPVGPLGRALERA